MVVKVDWAKVLGERVAIRCRTWEEMSSLKADNDWNISDCYYYEDKTCVDFQKANKNEPEWCDMDWYERNGYTIVDYEDVVSVFNFGDEIVVEEWQDQSKTITKAYFLLKDGNNYHCAIRNPLRFSHYEVFKAYKIHKKHYGIEITVKINGKNAKLSDIPDETLKKLKEM